MLTQTNPDRMTLTYVYNVDISTGIYLLETRIGKPIEIDVA
jgi:hypothetical protein